MLQIISSFKSQFYLQDYPIHPFFKCASSKVTLSISVGLDSVDTESSLLERKSNTKSRHTIWGLSTKAALRFGVFQQRTLTFEEPTSVA